MTLDEIVSRLEGLKKTGKSFVALCPAHDDRNPSLHVSRNSNGSVGLHCYTGCDTEAVCRAMGITLSDLFEKPLNGFHAASNGHSKGSITIGETLAQYDYRDADGIERYRNIRHSGPGRFYRKPSGIDSLPYRLPELLKARADGIADVFVCEGEKDCDNVRALGFTAVSLKGIKEAWAEYFAGMHVTIIQDHDAPGTTQASNIARVLAPKAASARIIDLYAGEPMASNHGKDVSNWIDERRSAGETNEEIAESLVAIAEATDTWRAETATTEEPPTQHSGFRFRFESLTELYQKPEETTSYVWDRTLPTGGFSILSAKPKVGKSTVLRNLALAISVGEPFLGRETLQGKVLYLCLEEKQSEIRRLFQSMQADGDSIYIHSGDRPKTSEEAVTALKYAIAELGPIAVFIDPLSRVIRSSDFNDYEIAYKLEPIIDLARNTGVHICALHHDGKGEREGGDAMLGSTALFGAVDCHLSMKKRQHGRTISSIQRYGDDLPETVIELDKETGLLMDRGDLATAVVAEIKAEILGCLPDGEWLKQADIKESMRNRNGGQVSKAITAMVNDGLLDRAGSGKRNDPFYYSRPTK